MSQSIIEQVLAGGKTLVHNGKKISFEFANYLQGADRAILSDYNKALTFFGKDVMLRLMWQGICHNVITQQGMFRAKDESGHAIDPDVKKVQEKLRDHVPSHFSDSPTSKQTETALAQAQEMAKTGLTPEMIQNVLKVGGYSETAIAYAINNLSS